MLKKNLIFRGLAILFALALLAGCSRTIPFSGQQAPASPLPPVSEPSQPLLTAPPAQVATLSITLSDYVDAATLSLLSQADRTEASNAIYYALRFGRPAAPRRWSGSGGKSGSVTVGPYVRQNAMECRDFVHNVTLGQETKTFEGRSCRNEQGAWRVVAAL